MLQPGQIFAGRYCIRRLIGSGAIADVYEAKHVLTEHAVALKVLRPSSPGASARNFALEARIDAQVGSPHIVHVQDAGVDETTGFPYLVLELLPGQTLAQLLQEQPEGRLPVEQALELLRQVALGLDAAHAYGVVHRNLKPENIFIGESRLVKIVDFGLAKVLDTSGQVTQQLRGTPFYMAAEQANLSAVSPQTDIWALGLVAYRMLTGRIYWRCANRRGREVASLGEVVLEISEPRRDPPSARLREDGVQLRLPEAFDEWLLRCIDVQPSRRFPSAGEAVAALRRALGSSEVATAPGAAELTLVSPTQLLPRAAAPEERVGVTSSAPATARPARARAIWKILGVAAGLGVLAASVFYPLQQAKPPAAVAPALTEVAAQGLTPAASAASAEAAAAELAPRELAPAVPEAQQPPGAAAPVAAAAAPVAAVGLLAQQDLPRVAPIRSSAVADAPEAPRARPEPAAKKRARAAARRARARAAQRARATESETAAQSAPAAQSSEPREAGLARKIGLGPAPAAPERPPPTALSD